MACTDHRPVERGGRWPRRADTVVSATILIITGGFHLYRGVPIEAVVFVVAGLAVVADGAGLLPEHIWHPFRLPGATLSVPLGVLGAAGLTVLPLKGAAETAALTGLGVVALAMVWHRPDRAARLPTRHRPTAWGWAGVGLALCLSQLIVYLLADPPLHQYAYPNLTVLLEPVVEMPVWRVVLITLWLLAGLALLRWSDFASSEPGHRRGPR